jgi:small-conductance mechanosensitive channel
MKPARSAALLLVVLAVSMLFVLPAAASDGADAADGDVGLVPYNDQLRINAGSSDTFRIEVVNYLGYSANDLSNSRMVTLEFTPIQNISISVDINDFVLSGQEHQAVNVTVSVNKYATADTYTIDIVLRIGSLDVGSPVLAATAGTVNLEVMSPLSSGDAFNRIMGIFDNPLPEPFNTPLATAVISFLLMLLIGTLAVMVVVPVLLRFLTRSHKEIREKLKATLRLIVPLTVSLYAFDISLRVYGASEGLIGTVESWLNVIYIILGALVVWKAYLILIHYMVAKISKTKHIGQKEVDIEPLLRLLGKMVIAVLAAAMILAAWGFSLAAIITGAGIVGLGITLGAQNVLNQFFSGMVLLITRPFKSGDIVKIGASNTIYKVSSVNIMNTVFENWDNKETVVMPNSAVSSSTIVNMTGDGLIYKITVFMRVSYESDIDLAQDLMKKVATEHPNVITNGSVDLPATRVTALLDSSIELRLTSYVYDFNDHGKISGELREAIFKVVKQNGISVPFPQMDVHLDMTGKDGPQKGEHD